MARIEIDSKWTDLTEADKEKVLKSVKSTATMLKELGVTEITLTKTGNVIGPSDYLIEDQIGRAIYSAKHTLKPGSIDEQEIERNINPDFFDKFAPTSDRHGNQVGWHYHNEVVIPIGIIAHSRNSAQIGRSKFNIQLRSFNETRDFDYSSGHEQYKNTQIAKLVIAL